MAQLEQALLALRSSSEASAFLRALLTTREIKTMRHRFQAMELSSVGATQRIVSSRLHISTTTATRAASAARANRRIIKLLLDRIEGGILSDASKGQ